VGLLVAPLAVDFVRSYLTRLEEADWDHVNRIYGEMEKEAAGILAGAGVGRERSSGSGPRHALRASSMRSPRPSPGKVGWRSGSADGGGILTGPTTGPQPPPHRFPGPGIDLEAKGQLSTAGPEDPL